MNRKVLVRVEALALAIALSYSGSALAANSAEATAAAQRHLAEKRGTPPAVARSGERAAMGSGGNWGAQLAACKAQAGANLIRREKCVWSHCNGHWAEGDCPPGNDWPPKFEMKKFEKPGFRRDAGAR